MIISNLFILQIFSLDLNAAETGVQPKQPLQKPQANEQKPNDSQCSC
jgi:hypothetical protein